MATIHHATLKTFNAIIDENSPEVSATLAINETTGNPEIVYEGVTYEAETAKELVAAFRKFIEDGDSEFEDMAIEGEQDEEDDEDVPATIVPPKYKAIYAQFHDSCGDELAEYLRGYLTTKAQAANGKSYDALDEVMWAQVATQNDIDSGRWSHLNNGQKRMNLGNVLRGKIRKGTDVVVGDRVFRGDAQSK